jgi:hypothetical protein
VKIAAPAFEHVLKYNPNHDNHGRFSSVGGGKGRISKVRQALDPLHRMAKEQAAFDKAADTIKAHNDQVHRDRAAGTGEHTTDAEYDAIMAAYRKKKKYKA